jgi:hypothetical protein
MTRTGVTRMKTSLAAALGAAALLATLPALAQSPHPSRHHGQRVQDQRLDDQRFDEGRTVYAPQRVCQPLCSMDTSPCDPPEFKAADGRCDYPMIGR